MNVVLVENRAIIIAGIGLGLYAYFVLVDWVRTRKGKK